VPRAIVTGFGGLIGCEPVGHLARTGFDVVGLDNGRRASLVGPDASTARAATELALDMAAVAGESPRSARPTTGASLTASVLR
jgi:nucleoside-diphosphate-sugar epimerase